MDWAEEDTRDEGNRIRVSAALGREVSPVAWTFILSARSMVDPSESAVFAEDVANARRLFSELEAIPERAETRATAPPESLDAPRLARPSPRHSGRRPEAVSYLAALDASDLSELQLFRRSVLSDGLLKAEEVEGWILRQAAADWEQSPSPGWRTLQWQTADAGLVSSLRVPADGVLERLVNLVEFLVRRYW